MFVLFPCSLQPEEALADVSPIMDVEEDQSEAEVSQNSTTEEIDQRENVSESLVPENDTVTSEPDILSFREYTQKALEEEQKKREIEKRKKTAATKLNHPESKETNKTIVTINSSGGLKKNFASLDCGAKIAAANAESQSASNIFTPSRDEYMRNACTDKAWFIVELCESIKALKIEIANHELYSSVFKDFRVSLSNVFPGRDKDWTLFGQFEAKDERFMQAFMSAEDGVFGKYVKVEILSHHGSEYFCPISSFKIYGISEIELIGADDDDPEDNQVHSEEQLAVSSTTLPSMPSLDNANPVMNMIKATFQSLIGGVFTPNEQIKNLDMSQALNQSSLEGSTFIYNVECPGCDDNRIRDVYFLLTFNYAQLSQTLNANQALKQALFNSVCQSYGFDGIEAEGEPSQTIIPITHGSCSGFPMVDFYVTLFGSSRIMALCNVIGIEAGRLGLVQTPLILPPWHRSNKTVSQGTEPEKETGGQTKVKTTPEDQAQKAKEAVPATKTLESVIEPSKTVDVPQVPETNSQCKIFSIFRLIIFFERKKAQTL